MGAFPVNYLEIILLSCFALGKNEVIHPALGIECLQCIDLTAPSLCMRRTKCSQDEICFTHKYTYSNIINYDMGCQTKRVCNMTNNRPKIIGRRDSKHTALHSARDGYSRTLCYECCDMEGCNSAMCTNNSAPSTSTSTSTPTSTTSTTSVTSTTSSTSTTSPSTTSSTSTTASTITSAKTTTTTTTTTTTPETVCSTGYVGFRSSCYAIVYKSVHWEGAQSRCHQLGSGVHLVSVNSLAEHQFLAKLLEDNHFPAKEIWIGGYVHPFFRRWTWDDGSTFNYTSWVSGYPINDRRRDRITMVNPTVSTVFSGWNWKNTPSSDYYAFICEVKSEFV